ncbi:MAG: FlgD immunoglobulin-like domain containing protein [bacterium]
MLRACLRHHLCGGEKRHCRGTAANTGKLRTLPEYPNPFKPETTIEFDLQEASQVTLIIYNLHGQNIRTLLRNVEYEAGSHPIFWDGTDDAGNRLASGIYFYWIKAGGVENVKKLVLTK